VRIGLAKGEGERSLSIAGKWLSLFCGGGGCSLYREKKGKEEEYIYLALEWKEKKRSRDLSSIASK